MEECCQEDTEKTVARIERRIAAEPRHATVMRKVLVLCEEPRALEELDAEIGAYPEMRSSAFAPRTVLSWLVDVGAIEELVPGCKPAGEETSSGEEPGEEVQGFEGDAEDALFSSNDSNRGPICFATTEAGLIVANSHRPSGAIEELVMEGEPRYGDAYLLVLNACSKPQSKKQLEELLNGNPAMENPKLYASFFIDKLERAGAVVWDGGWCLTKEGRSFVESNG